MISQEHSSIAYGHALVGAAVSLIFVRTGFLGWLFLLPLGLAAYCCNPRTAWLSALVALGGNSLIVLGLVWFMDYDPRFQGWGAVYYALTVLVFTWIVVPPLWTQRRIPVPAAYRLVLGAVIASAAMAPLFYWAQNDQEVRGLVLGQADAAASLYAAGGSSGGDAVQRFFSEQLTPELILDSIIFIGLRGGMVVSCLLFLVLSRQLALMITRFVRHIQPGGNLIAFHTGSWLIWGLSFSLAAVLLGRLTGIGFMEIAGWNILVLCASLYLAQGGGIALYLFARAPLPVGFRFLVNILVVVILFSPGINAAVLGALILLGIAENWVPFRVPKSDGPSSTPMM
jgi:hypothetical protein